MPGVPDGATGIGKVALSGSLLLSSAGGYAGRSEQKHDDECPYSGQ